MATKKPTFVGLREALSKVEAIQEESWTKDNFNVELTKALTTLENARMEWNGARLKLPVLCGQMQDGNATTSTPGAAAQSPFASQSFGELCRVGLALTWPLAAAALLAFAGLLLLLLRR